MGDAHEHLEHLESKRYKGWLGLCPQGARVADAVPLTNLQYIRKYQNPTMSAVDGRNSQAFS